MLESLENRRHSWVEHLLETGVDNTEEQDSVGSVIVVFSRISRRDPRCCDEFSTQLLNRLTEARTDPSGGRRPQNADMAQAETLPTKGGVGQRFQLSH